MHISSLDSYLFMSNLMSSILLFTFHLSSDYFEANLVHRIILSINILTLSLKDKESFYKPKFYYFLNGKEYNFLISSSHTAP